MFAKLLTVKRKLVKSLIPIIALASLFAIQPSFGQTIEGYHGAFGPQGIVRISSPVLSWKVWADPGQSLTSLKMVVDGQPVDATYDANSQMLSWTPTKPLSAGNHQVQCVVVVENLLRMKQSWSLTVAEDATSTLPEESSVQDKILQFINDFRTQQGLPLGTVNGALAAAAKAHSHYLALNHTFGHTEQPGNSGFVGNNLEERYNAFGWTGGGYEDVGVEMGGSAHQTIADLFAAPYHRIPFLQPGALSVGAADESHRTTVEFSYSNDNGLELSPANHAVGQPNAWDGSEIPSPLRFWDTHGPYGYPIMIAGFGADHVISGGHIALSDSNGNWIDCYCSNPKTDTELRSALLAIPKYPLPNGVYEAHAKVEFANGKNQDISWAFSVGPKQ